MNKIILLLCSSGPGSKPSRADEKLDLTHGVTGAGEMPERAERMKAKLLEINASV